MNKTDSLNLKELIQTADRAGFYLRALERGDDFSTSERTAIRLVAGRLQEIVDTALDLKEAQRRNLEDRTDRVGTVYATAHDLRAAHRAQRAKLMAQPSPDLAKIKVARGSLELRPGTTTLVMIDERNEAHVHIVHAHADELKALLKTADINTRQVSPAFRPPHQVRSCS